MKSRINWTEISAYSCGMVGVIALIYLFLGWLASELWRLAVMPIFGAPYIPIPHMIGIILLIGLVTSFFRSK